MGTSHLGSTRRATSFLLFVGVGISACVCLYAWAIYLEDQVTTRAKYVASSFSDKVQYAIDSRLLSAEVLKIMIVDGNGAINNFERVAQQIYKQDEAIRSLQLAPNGIVSDVYPLKGNENAFIDLFADAERNPEAKRARDTGKTTLAGPFELRQGGMGLVARMPIYIGDTLEQREFWGFSIVVLNMPHMFSMVKFEDLKGQGYDFRLWRIKPETDDVQIIMGDTSHRDFSDAVIDRVDVPNGRWILSLLPANGSWVGWRQLAGPFCCILIISCAIIFLLRRYFALETQRSHFLELSEKDALTGLYNLRKFVQVVEQHIEQDVPFALLFFDVNKFKEVNDSFGHAEGDRLLVAITQRIQSCLRKWDFLFRIGGDEFALVVPHAGDAAFYAELEKRIEQAVGQPFTLGAEIRYPQVSCGVAFFPEDGTEVESLVRQADKKMYVKKRCV